MHYSDLLRDEARRFRREAELARDPSARQDLLECAEACEEFAAYVDRLRSSG